MELRMKKGIQRHEACFSSKISTILQRQKKCSWIIQCLSDNAHNVNQHEEDNEHQYKQLNRQDVQLISISTCYNNNNKQLQRYGHNLQSTYIQHKHKQIGMKQTQCNKSKNQNPSKTNKNELIRSIQQLKICVDKQKKQDQKDICSNFEGTNKVFENIQIKQTIYNYQQTWQQQIDQSQLAEEYFQINIFNKNNQQDEQNGTELHQVKMYSQQKQTHQTQLNNKNACNLSNFSSFNLHSSKNNNSATQQSIQRQRQFYQKQFIYLIKKIQLTQGKKLTSTGIQKIANQLTKMIQGNVKKYLKPHQDAILKNNFLKAFNKKQITVDTKKFKISCDRNLQEKVGLRNMYQEKLLIKQKEKVNQKISSLSTPFVVSKVDLNKQNFRNNIEILKNCVDVSKNKSNKYKDRSTSPLSYKVLMQKKKNIKQNNINRKVEKITQLSKPSSNKKGKQNHNNYKNFQSELKNNKIQHCSRDQTSFNKQSKPSLLKIMLCSDIKQSKIKTLYFQYFGQGQNLSKQVQGYCIQNKIQGKNKKYIQGAIHNHKSIITIRQ